MRKGEWMQTATGRAFWPLDPRSEEVFIEDIAHALANQCRFAGHTRKHYSVAQHSVLVSRLLGDDDPGRAGLLHDAAEAYVVDLPRPLKKSGALDSYEDIERRVADAISTRFGLPCGCFEATAVKRADCVVLMTEKRDLLAPSPLPWSYLQPGESLAPLNEVIVPWAPMVAHYRFLERFEELFGKVGDGRLYDVVMQTRKV